jgi:glutathione S-transferase
MSHASARLITLPPSTDCETARWLLDHYEVPYQEERHTPFFLFSALRKAGGSNQYPLYQHRDLTLAPWQAIFNHFESKADPEDQLTPRDDEAARLLQGQIDRFQAVLAEEAPKWVFGYLLPNRRLTNAAFAFGAPWYERFIVNALYFSVRIVMARGLGTSRDIAEEAGDKLRGAYDDLDALLMDGRSYLTGDQFTLLDVVVCAHGGLTVMPAEYGAPLPALQSLPEPLGSEVEAFRARPAGQYMLRMFAERRRPPRV